MYSIYQLKANELDDKFLKSLKTLFQDKEIEIIVQEHDETEYLTRSEANKKRLINAIKNAEKGKNLTEFSFEKES